jgi:anti-sigma regulatory factor (Ser/Thr protein kinase)
LHRSGEIQQLAGKPEVPLAARPEHRYENREVMLQPGDTLFVCTDGVFEAMSSGEEFYGRGRVEADLRASCNIAPEAVVNTVKQHVDAFAGQAPRADDITMVAVRWQPAALTTATELVIVNDIAQLARISEAMDRIGAEHGIADKALMHLQVALDEIVSNVIKYAWHDHKPHEISIRIAVLTDGVRVDILDDGVAFDPRLSQPPERPTSGSRQLGGLGIHIVKQLVDSLEYARVDGRNQLTLVKRCIVRAPSR